MRQVLGDNLTQKQMEILQAIRAGPTKAEKAQVEETKNIEVDEQEW